MSNEITEVKLKIASLQEAILADAPQLPTLLQEIHKILIAQGDIVTALTDDEIRTMMEAAKQWKNIQLAPKPKAKTTKSTKDKGSEFDFGSADLTGLDFDFGS